MLLGSAVANQVFILHSMMVNIIFALYSPAFLLALCLDRLSSVLIFWVRQLLMGFQDVTFLPS